MKTILSAKIPRSAACALFLGMAISQTTLAQQPIPLQNQAAAAATNAPHPEVEVVEIRRGGALPVEIHRPTGRFILLVINRTHDAAASFALDPASVGDGVTGPHPLLRLGAGVASTRLRLAGLVDLPSGQYHLKVASTGKILCRITIE